MYLQYMYVYNTHLVVWLVFFWHYQSDLFIRTFFRLFCTGYNTQSDCGQCIVGGETSRSVIKSKDGRPLHSATRLQLGRGVIVKAW